MKHARKVLIVSGHDRAKFLGDLLTISVSEDMALRYGALLSPIGKIVSDLFVWGEGAALYLDLPIRIYERVKMLLSMYKLRADVVLEDSELQVFQCLNGVIDPRNPALGCRYYGGADDETISVIDYKTARIENRIAEFDLDYGTIEAYPIEWRFGEMGGIDYKKGCYVGQEIAARMRHKTELQKTVLRVNYEGVLGEDMTVFSGEKKIGRLLSHTDAQGLAFLKLSESEGELRVGSARLSLHKIA